MKGRARRGEIGMKEKREVEKEGKESQRSQVFLLHVSLRETCVRDSLPSPALEP